jgi:large subunit ribosomal protein L25
LAGAGAGAAPLHSTAVAGSRVKLTVSERTHLGSSESRRLRKQGLIPGVLYGREEPIAIAVAERELRAALTTPAGSHAVLDVEIDGGKQHSAILKEYQRDRVRGQITHVDLQEVRLDQPIQSAVVVTLIGEPVGVKEGGVLSQVGNEVNVEGLPLEIPQHLELDVSGMQIGDSLRLADLAVPEGITFLDDPEETVLATVTAPQREEAAEGAAAEGAEGAADGGEEAEEASEEAADAEASGGEDSTEG